MSGESRNLLDLPNEILWMICREYVDDYTFEWRLDCPSESAYFDSLQCVTKPLRDLVGVCKHLQEAAHAGIGLCAPEPKNLCIKITDQAISANFNPWHHLSELEGETICYDFSKAETLTITVLPPQDNDGDFMTPFPEPGIAIANTVHHCLLVVAFLNAALGLPKTVRIEFEQDPKDPEQRWYWCEQGCSNSHCHKYLERSMLPFNGLQYRTVGVEKIEVKIPHDAHGCHLCWAWHNQGIQPTSSLDHRSQPDWGRLPIRYIIRPTRDEDRKARGLPPLPAPEQPPTAEETKEADRVDTLTEQKSSLFEAVAYLDGIRMLQYPLMIRRPWAIASTALLKHICEMTEDEEIFEDAYPEVTTGFYDLEYEFHRLCKRYELLQAWGNEPGEYECKMSERLRRFGYFATPDKAIKLLKVYEEVPEPEDEEKLRNAHGAVGAGEVQEGLPHAVEVTAETEEENDDIEMPDI